MTDVPGIAPTLAARLLFTLSSTWTAATATEQRAIAEVSPDLADVLRALPRPGQPRARRCANCGHLDTYHGEGGCWHTLTRARPDQNLVCACPHTSAGHPPRTATTRSDVELVGWALHADGPCIRHHDHDPLPEADNRLARVILAALTAAGRLATEPTPDAIAVDPNVGGVLAALQLVEDRLRAAAVTLETRGGVHRGTAAGVRLACTKVAALAADIRDGADRMTFGG